MDQHDRAPRLPAIGRRDFLTRMGIGIGAAATGAATGGLAPAVVNAAAPPAKVKGNIPDKP